LFLMIGPPTENPYWFDRTTRGFEPAA